MTETLTVPHGWVFLSEDSGWEFSENHPIESGECDDARNIRAATEMESILARRTQQAEEERAAALVNRDGHLRDAIMYRDQRDALNTALLEQTERLAAQTLVAEMAEAMRIAERERAEKAEKERDAAVRAQQIAERDYAIMKERAETWRKEADRHLTAQAEQVAKRREAEARAELFERPDMFWWADDPEQLHQSIYELIDYHDVRAGEVAEVQTASRLPNRFVVWGPQPAEDEDVDGFPGLKEFDTEVEAKAYAAALPTREESPS